MSEPPVLKPHLIDLADSPASRVLQCSGRALRKQCPYCGHGGVFSSWFSIRKQCPTCGITFAYEDGYFLGSYVVNLVATEFIAVATVIALLIWSDLSVLQLQVIGVTLAVGLPLVGYPFALLFWMVIDIAVHPPDPATGKRPI